MILKLYADETFDDKTKLLQIAGYLMTEEQFIDLDERVRSARGCLRYFHMKEGHHVKYIAVYKQLVNLITPESVLCGFCVSLSEKTHKQVTSAKVSGQKLSYWMGKPYTYGLGQNNGPMFMAC